MNKVSYILLAISFLASTATAATAATTATTAKKSEFIDKGLFLSAYWQKKSFELKGAEDDLFDMRLPQHELGINFGYSRIEINRIGYVVELFVPRTYFTSYELYLNATYTNSPRFYIFAGVHKKLFIFNTAELLDQEDIDDGFKQEPAKLNLSGNITGFQTGINFKTYKNIRLSFMASLSSGDYFENTFLCKELFKLENVALSAQLFYPINKKIRLWGSYSKTQKGRLSIYNIKSEEETTRIGVKYLL